MQRANLGRKLRPEVRDTRNDVDPSGSGRTPESIGVQCGGAASRGPGFRVDPESLRTLHMPIVRRRAGAIVAILSASLACAGFARGQTGAYPAETILHYVRSNRDGSEAEHIHVFLKDQNQVAVYKMRSLGTDAALVTGVLDPKKGHATALVGGRLQPDGTQSAKAWLRHNPETSELEVNFEGPGAPTEFKLPLKGASPWRMYDFDLADSNAIGAGKHPTRDDFQWELVMARPDARQGEPPICNLGELRAEFRGEEEHGDRPTFRYDVSGTAFNGSEGGTLWLDAVKGIVVEASWGLPNHPGYKDFRLVLVGEGQGEDAWRKLLSSHYAESRDR